MTCCRMQISLGYVITEHSKWIANGYMLGSLWISTGNGHLPMFNLTISDRITKQFLASVLRDAHRLYFTAKFRLKMICHLKSVCHHISELNNDPRDQRHCQEISTLIRFQPDISESPHGNGWWPRPPRLPKDTSHGHRARARG